MPKVPIRDQQVNVGAAPNVRLNVKATEEQFGGGQVTAQEAQAMRGLVRTTADVFAEEAKRADESWAQGAQAEVMRKRNARTYDKGGLVDARGEAALATADEIKNAFKTDLDDIAETATTPRQKAMYAAIRQREEAEFDGAVTRHVAGETEAIRDNRFKASLASLGDDSAKNPWRATGNASQLKAMSIDYAREKGLDPQATAEKVVSDMHKGVVDRLLAEGRAGEANRYYKNNAKDIKDDVSTLKMLNEGVSMEKSQAIAENILLQHSDKATALESLKDKKLEPQIEAITRRLITQGFDDREKINWQKKITGYAAASAEIEAGGMPKPAMLEHLDDGERKRLSEYEKVVRNGGVVSDDTAKYNELVRLAAVDPQSFMQLNLQHECQTSLTKKTTNDLMQFQMGLRSGDNNAQRKLDEIQTDSQVINRVLADAGIKPNPKMGSKEAQRSNIFWDKLNNFNRAYQIKFEGKKPSQEELQAEADRLVMETKIDRSGFFSGNKRLFEIAIDDVPIEDQTAIAAYLRKRRIPINDKNITEIYIKRLQKENND